MGRKPKPRYKPWKGLKSEWVDVARQRTDYLVEPHPISVQPLRMSLINAYLQGIADAAEAMGDTSPSISKQPAPEGLQ